MMSLNAVREIRDNVGKKGSEGVVISFDELSRIKNTLSVQKVQDKQSALAVLALKKDQAMMESAAKIRKEKMSKV